MASVEAEPREVLTPPRRRSAAIDRPGRSALRLPASFLAKPVGDPDSETMKIRLRAVGRVLWKEVREASRDRNLVVNLVLVPVFLYPVLGFGAFQLIQVIQGVAERQAVVIGVLGEVPSAVADSLEAPERREIVLVPSRHEAGLRSGYPETFRALRADALSRVLLRQDQFHTAELIIDAAKRGIAIGEVPVTVRRRSSGESKKGRDWSYGLSFARTVLKTWWRD